MATITTKETRAFNWANPGTLKVGDEIVETLKDSREVVFVVMDGGVIVEQGDPEDVFGAPKMERTKQFLKNYGQS